MERQEKAMMLSGEEIDLTGEFNERNNPIPYALTAEGISATQEPEIPEDM
jgi:hypothetical protein